MRHGKSSGSLLWALFHSPVQRSFSWISCLCSIIWSCQGICWFLPGSLSWLAAMVSPGQARLPQRSKQQRVSLITPPLGNTHRFPDCRKNPKLLGNTTSALPQTPRRALHKAGDDYRTLFPTISSFLSSSQGRTQAALGVGFTQIRHCCKHGAAQVGHGVVPSSAPVPMENKPISAPEHLPYHPQPPGR